jgi:polysaccharide export outer membrane protein
MRNTPLRKRRPSIASLDIVRLLAAILLSSLAGTAVLGAADYVLGPDDVLTVTVLRHPELSVDAVPVSVDGTISLPIVGQVMIVGRTVPQVTQEITKGLSRRLVAPEVTVMVRQVRPQRVFVLGAVSRPGVYEMKPGWGVAEALAAAGSLLSKPEAVTGLLLRPDGTTITVDLPTLLVKGDPASNTRLIPGDVLNLVARTMTISVAGQVLKPGTYELRAGGGVLEGLALAGGVTPQADLTKVTVDLPP